MEIPSKTFEYNALRHKHNNIRLLHLLPGQFSDPIRCSMEEVDFETPIDYDALSYCWGDGNYTRSIEICHHLRAGRLAFRNSDLSLPLSYLPDEAVSFKQLPIKANLEAALRRLRYVDKVRRMWIDAACINQKDNRERSAQVQVMGKIYTEAFQVVVWLGELGNKGVREEASITGFRYLRSLKERMALAGFSWDAALDDPTNLPTETNLHSVEEICGQPWFSRLWVQQEHILARKPVELLCGPEKMLLQDFLTAVRFVVRQLELHKVLLSSSLYHVMRICGYRSFFRTRGFGRRAPYEKLLVALLKTSGFLEAAEPRDKIYGLLGLLRLHDPVSGLVPDYEKDIAEVHLDLSVKLMQETGSLAVLQGINYPSTRYPSWVSEWNTISEPSFSPNDKFAPYTSITIIPATKVLRTKAVALGNVVASYQINSSSESEYKDALDDTAECLQQFPKVRERYAKSGSALELQNLPLSEWSLKLPRGQESFIEKPKVFRSKARQSQLSATSLADYHIQAAIFVLSSGAVGSLIGRKGCQDLVHGDGVYLFPGCAQPHLLRRCGQDFRIVCRCTIDGYGAAEMETHLSILQKGPWEDVPLI